MALDFIKKMFSNTPENTDAAGSVQHGAQDIATQLSQFLQANTLLEGELVNAEGVSTASFTTGLAAISSENQFFIIEEIAPAPVSNQIKSGDHLRFTVNHCGERIQFSTTYMERDDLGAKHRIQFPKGIEHVQLRNAFRLKISRVSPVYLELSHTPPATADNPTPEVERLNGYVSDISITGARLHIEGKLNNLERGKLYNPCTVLLGDQQTIQTSARLMHWQCYEQDNETQLGMQFQDLKPPEEKLLARFISDIQRKYRALNR